jgi:TPR repeat protein
VLRSTSQMTIGVFNFRRPYATSLSLSQDAKVEQPILNVNSFRDVEAAALGGDADAMAMLGSWYWGGTTEVAQDVTRGLQLLEDAAAKGSSLGRFNLGVAICDENPHRSSELWRLAADSGMAEAQYNLGVNYMYGYGVEQNEKTAVLLIEQAAAQDHPEALCFIAVTHAVGDLGKTKDLNKAFSYYERAARINHPDGLFNLSHFYEEGIGGAPENKQYAVILLQAASAQGHLPAQYNLGRCYYYGIGVEKDLKKAIDTWTVTAEEGYPAAQFYLGGCYYSGNGVPKDDTKAKELWEAAANQDYREAQQALQAVFGNKGNE